MTERTRIRPRDRDAILQSLKAGVVPRRGHHHVQVGRAEEVKALVRDTERIADGGSAVRFVIGEYGSGKTFFLHLVRSVAHEHGLVTMHADLTPDRRLQSSTGHARSLYAELARNLSTRTNPEGGAMRSVVERFVGSARQEAQRRDRSTANVIRDRLEALSELHGGYDFADVIGAYWEGYDEGHGALKGSAVRWLRREYTTKTDARRDLGVRSYVEDDRFYDQLKLLARFVTLAGYGGLLVSLDEMVNLYKLSSTRARKRNYEQILRIVSTAPGTGVGLQVRGYEERPARLSAEEADRAEKEGREVSLAEVVSGDAVDIARHLFATLRGGRHIVFANRRADVEQFAALLRELSDRRRAPNEFWPHHGSLDRTLREDAEEALKRGGRPATLLATTTLVLGIDVGRVESIAQIGPPPAVASMRQRLGRSGRRGQAAALRIYVQEREVGPRTAPQDQLRTSLVQTVAMVRLLAERWYEPPPPAALHLSTLVQQVLSLMAQHGGVQADQAFGALCRAGPFRSVTPGQFARLLRDLAGHELVQQTHTGELILDLGGERLVNHYEFYAAFSTPEEYRIVCGPRTLGSLPILFPLFPGASLIFAGRRWRVVRVDDRAKRVEVERAAGGKPPLFGGQGALLHRRVREEMRRVYLASDRPPYLDSTATELLEQGRGAFRRLRLKERALLEWGRDTLLFPWTGGREMNTLLLQLRACGLDVALEGCALLIRGLDPPGVIDQLRALAAAGPGPAEELEALAHNKQTEKHHVFLSGPLLGADYASSKLDPEGAHAALRGLPELE